MKLLRIIGFISLAGLAVDAAEPNFQAQTVDDAIQIGYGITIGDVDGDKKPDILLADKSEIAWYKNPGQRQKAWSKSVIARNLTQRDNVCLAARDIDGDGMVEVAVGAQWNPGQTSDAKASGALFFLKRGKDPANPWTAFPILPHDPTTHRMHWLRNSAGKFGIAVLPLHGVGNQGGAGKPVRVSLYTASDTTYQSWNMTVLDESLHMTHNFDLVSANKGEDETLLVGGKEGIRRVSADGNSTLLVTNPPSRGAGEVRRMQSKDFQFVAIEPMHGNEVVHYAQTGESWQRTVIDASLSQGHALATADLLGNGNQEVVAGWRGRNSDGKFGVKLYVHDAANSKWKQHLIDDNQMACEDLKLADLDNDGKLDIIAAGRATKNVKIYWNR